MENLADDYKGLSFRAQLILFGLSLILIVALPVLAVELRRPGNVLDALIKQGNAVLAGVESGMDAAELQRMNKFALRVSPATDGYNEDYLILAFNMLITQGELSSEPDIIATLRERGSDLKDFDYGQVEKAFAFWRDQLSSDPGLAAIFGKYKRLLGRARQNARSGGFEYDDVYIMVDDGKTFAFLLNGSTDWTNSIYPGLKYDFTKSHDEYWRDYWQQGPGYYANPRHYRYHLFPKFDTDRWGTWFTIWLAAENEGIYNAISMDFEASSVKREMWTVAAFVFAVGLAITLVLAVVSHKISALLNVPIKNIIAATEAVIHEDYGHVVPVAGGRDFRKPIATMNLMIQGLQERFNMMQTLERLFSRGVAEQAAKHGLVLSGQKVIVTNVLAGFAGFSAITKSMDPEKTIGILNEYFTEIIPIIKKWGGSPNKYLGDAIVAIFGAPLAVDNHAENAVACAIAMQRAMRRINGRRTGQGLPTLEMRIGVNSGDVIAGVMGSNADLEYALIGDTTKLAGRMESKCEIGQVLLTGATYYYIKHIFFKGAYISPTPHFIEFQDFSLPVPSHNVYAADVKITANAAADFPDGFIIERADRGLPLTPEDQDPDHPERFTKTVIIE